MMVYQRNVGRFVFRADCSVRVGLGIEWNKNHGVFAVVGPFSFQFRRRYVYASNADAARAGRRIVERMKRS